MLCNDHDSVGEGMTAFMLMIVVIFVVYPSLIFVTLDFDYFQNGSKENDANGRSFKGYCHLL